MEYAIDYLDRIEQNRQARHTATHSTEGLMPLDPQNVAEIYRPSIQRPGKRYHSQFSPASQPLGSYLLVTLEIAKETIGDTGLVRPQVSMERPDFGTVLAIGPNVQWIEPDDVVAFHKYAGKDIDLDGRKYLLLKEEEIMCLVARSVAVGD